MGLTGPAIVRSLSGMSFLRSVIPLYVFCLSVIAAPTPSAFVGQAIMR
jgi:hypothetical protein